ncbi:O-antigen ligase domain-containing protein [Lacibacter luteus]|uniref:O-antigen ligase domain-containing protein n=1 Tax=Lacibacter luteus TaxID=2508719 RepID=A0A4Q1CKG4_9BACT|nr:O-antigen ligase family protein [Lacibacter luteus]RXK60868.1 O-antigen ligase domain-containing protein [Lacibacter luteus]
MQALFTRKEAFTFWLPAAAAITCFVAAVVLDQKLLLVLPFAVLGSIAFGLNIRFLFFALLFAIPLSTEFEVTATLSTDLPDEPLMLLLAGSLFVLFLIKPQLIPVEIKKSSLVLLLLLQLVWMLVTVLFSHEVWLSIKYCLAKSWFIMAFVVGGLYFLRTKEDFATASKALIFSMLIPVLYSLIRHAGKGFSFEAINATLDPFFRNHVNYSALLVCLSPVLLLWYRFANQQMRKWVLACMALFLVALFFAYSRGAWLCLLSGFITWYAVQKRFLLSLIAGALLLAAVSLFLLIQNDNYMKFAPDFNTTRQHFDLNEHLEATYTLKDMSTMERFYRWIAGVKMVNEEKLKGYGPNTFTTYYKEYTVASFKTWVSSNEEKSSVHNYFLLVTIEQGLPALLILLALLISMFAIAVKAYHTLNDPFERSLAITAAVILSMIVTLNLLSDLIETDKIGSIYFLLLGIFIRLHVKLKEQQSKL